MKIFKTKKAYDILELIQRNPERYLSERTIIALEDFIDGYLIGNPYPEDKPPFNDFGMYLLHVSDFENKVGNGKLISRILMHECNGDKFLSFDRFFEYLELYKKSKFPK